MRMFTEQKFRRLRRLFLIMYIVHDDDDDDDARYVYVCTYVCRSNNQQLKI